MSVHGKLLSAVTIGFKRLAVDELGEQTRQPVRRIEPLHPFDLRDVGMRARKQRPNSVELVHQQVGVRRVEENLQRVVLLMVKVEDLQDLRESTGAKDGVDAHRSAQQASEFEAFLRRRGRRRCVTVRSSAGQTECVAKRGKDRRGGRPRLEVIDTE